MLPRHSAASLERRILARSLRDEPRAKDFEPILSKAMEKDKRSRYQSAAQLLADLKALRAGAPSTPVLPDASAETVFRIILSDQEIPLTVGENLIGRTRNATVRLDSSGVSRRHALIEVHGDEAVVRDCGSKNGRLALSQ